MILRKLCVWSACLAVVVSVHTVASAAVVGFEPLSTTVNQPMGDTFDDLIVVHNYAMPDDGIVTAINAAKDSDTADEVADLLILRPTGTTDQFTIVWRVTLPPDETGWTDNGDGTQTYTFSTPLAVLAGDIFGHYHDVDGPFGYRNNSGGFTPNPGLSRYDTTTLSSLPAQGGTYNAALSPNTLSGRRDYLVNLTFVPATVVPAPAALPAGLGLMGLMIARRRV